ncbi:uncharacterized protein BXZ73DRAFT_36727, partial [Epithele typhae]|uniref:uncharacterized protein n=1 Tax=Epithele typhae TaxID=378194 RepID=UPI002008B929
FTGPASNKFYIAALIVEIVFFGANIVTFSYGTYIMVWLTHPQKRRTTGNVILLVSNTLMFLLSSVHVILDVFVAHEGWGNVPISIDQAKFMLYVSQTILGDGFMVYRLFRVFNRSWTAIMVPSMLIAADAVIGYSSTFLGVTGYYIREFRHVSPRKETRKIWRVIEATVQSTAIYAAAGVSLVITFANSAAIGYPTCLNLFPALIGLVFSFTAIRVAHGSTGDPRPDSHAHSASSASGRATFGS